MAVDSVLLLALSLSSVLLSASCFLLFLDVARYIFDKG